MTNTDLKSHWNKVYNNADINKLGWYEKSCIPSLELIQKCNLKEDSRILHIGAGATLLIDELIDLGYNNHIVNDLSSNALDILEKRLKSKNVGVKFIEDDITNSTNLNIIEPVDLWHDRAVLHFFNDKEEKDSYFSLLNKLVKPGGNAIIAAFSLDGTSKCSGLDVNRYSQEMITNNIGVDFEFVNSFNFKYTMPSGDKRKYIYTLYKKKK